MNWKLIVLLSGFGLIMGIATVYVIPSKIEPLFWLGIFVVCAAIIAKRAPGRYFLHGLCVSLLNSVWITSAHILLFDRYAEGHAEEMAMGANYHLPPRLMMALVGPVIGLVSGLVLGLFSFGASKLLKPSPAAPSQTADV
jgi:hypothetical protein